MYACEDQKNLVCPEAEGNEGWYMIQSNYVNNR